MTDTARTVYIALVRLHPRGFRADFSREMLCVFDEAAATYGVRWLLRDALLSLLRQRLLRSQDEGASVVTEGPFSLLAGSYPNIRAPHLTLAKLSGALVLTLLSFFIYPPPTSWQQTLVRSVKPALVEVRYGVYENR